MSRPWRLEWRLIGSARWLFPQSSAQAAAYSWLPGGEFGTVAGSTRRFRQFPPRQRFFGLLCTTAGGFVAAHIARGKEMRHAFATGLFSLVTGLLFSAAASDASPLWYKLISSLLVIPCALLGGYLRTGIKRSDIQPQPSISQPPIPHP
jgi:hypothetical protein